MEITTIKDGNPSVQEMPLDMATFRGLLGQISKIKKSELSDAQAEELFGSLVLASRLLAEKGYPMVHVRTEGVEVIVKL